MLTDNWCSCFLLGNSLVNIGLQRICLQCGRPGFNTWVEKIPWRRAWQPTPVFLPGESPWTGEPGGLQSMGSWRVGHDWATKHSTMPERHCNHLKKKWTNGVGGRFKREQIYIYLWLIHVDVWQTPMQYYKSIIPRLKITFLKSKLNVPAGLGI